MSNEELNELAALYSMGLLEGEELSRFEAALKVNSDAQAALALYSDTADLVALSAEEVEPPAGLEDRIFDSLPERNSPEIVSIGTENAETVTRFPTWVSWGVAALLAISGGMLFNQKGELQETIAQLLSTIGDQNETIEEQIETIDSQLNTIEEQGQAIVQQDQIITNQVEVIAQLENSSNSLQNEVAELLASVEDRDSQIVQLESDGALKNLKIAVLASKLENAPNAQAVAVWNEAQQAGRLTVSDLPTVDPDKDYQLWIIDPAYESPVSAGVFNTNADGSYEYSFSGTESISSINAFALSLESKGGNASPLGPIVMVSQ